MAVMPLVWDVNADADVLDIAALTPSDGDMLYWATGGTRYNTVPSTSYMRGLLNTASEAALKAAVNLEIGVDVQAYDADLTTWAGLTPSAYFQTLVDDADAATARATLGLSIGSQVQAYDADLTTWAGVTPGTGVATALAVAVGSAGAPVINGGALGTPSSGTLTSATGLPISTGVSGLGTGIATALAINTGSAGAPVLVNGALGTPSSGTLTNATGLPVGGISGLGTGVATFLATPSSANLAAAVTDETGSGALYFTGGALGTPASATLTNATGLPVSGITASTSTALGVGSIELGHASDTTLSRVSAGRMAVEGSNVLMASDVGTSGTKLPYLDGVNTWSGAQKFATNSGVKDANPILGWYKADGTRLAYAQAGDTSYLTITMETTDQGINLVSNGSGVVAANGVAIDTISGTATLSNKTLSSPTVSGTIAGAASWSGAQTFSASPVLDNATAIGVLFKKSAANKWVAGMAAGTGTGDNFEFYNYTLGGNALVINSATNAAAFTAGITSGGVAVPTISSTDTLTNKTLSSPTLSGTVAGSPSWSGVQTFPDNSKIGDLLGGNGEARLNDDAAFFSWYNGANTVRSGYLQMTAAGGAVLASEISGANLNITTAGAGALQYNSVAIPTISSTDTLSNKTLSSPTLSGTVAGSPTLSGTWTYAAAPIITTADQSTNRLRFANTGGGGRTWEIVGGRHGSENSSFSIYDVTAAATRFLINSTGVLYRGDHASIIADESNTLTLTNKTLSSPTLSGTVAGSPTFSGACTFPNLTTNSNGFSRIIHQDGGTSIWSAGLRDDNDANYYLYQESGAGYVSISGGGVVIGSPTGGAKGAGTLNCTAAYDDNVLLTDLVLDYAVTNTFDAVKYANHPLRDQVAPWWFDPDQYAEFWKAERRLPGMLTWDDPADKPSTGESITRLTAVVEMQAALIENLNQRLKELEQ